MFSICRNCWKVNSLRVLKCRNRSTVENMGKNSTTTIVSLSAGAGFLAGITGIMIFQYLKNRRYILMLEENILRLTTVVDKLRLDFSEIRKKLLEEVKGGRSRWSSGASTTDASMYSALESDADEFCDVSDSEEADEALLTSSSGTYITANGYFSGTMDAGILEKVDEMLNGSDVERTKAYGLLLELNDKKPNDHEILCRLARACHAMSVIEEVKGNVKGKQDFIERGIEYGRKSLELKDDSAMGHKWYGICVGVRCNYLGTKEKIKEGVVFKEHIEKAIKYDPADPILYNLLARFEFELATLSMFERNIAKMFFGEVPKATMEDALGHFQQSEKLNDKPWKENRLWLAKALIQQKKYAEAVPWLDKALAVEPKTAEDSSTFDEEIKKLLKKYGNYRVTVQ